MTDTSPNGYKIRTAAPADEPVVRELLEAMIGGSRVTQWTPEFWSWKHKDGPYGPSYVACAEETATGQVVSVQHAMPWRLKCPSSKFDSGEHFIVSRTCDGATAPEHQRRGLYFAIDVQTQHDLQAAGRPCFFCTPNEKTLGRNLKTGWAIAARVPVQVRPRLSPRALKGLLGGTPDAAAVAASALEPWEDFRERHGDELERVISGHEGNRPQVGCRTDRSLAYLDWRYGDIPTASYGAHSLTSEEGLTSFLVARAGMGARGLPVLVVLEMFLENPTPKEGARLLRSLLRRLPCGYLVACFTRGTVEHQALRRTGFLPAPGRRITVTAHQLLSAPHDPTRADSWDLTYGDLEVF